MADTKYFVVGATGSQGGSVVKALLAEGVPGANITGMTRNPDSEKAKSLASLGCCLVKGDLNDPTSLTSLKGKFEGTDSVFVVTDYWQSCGLDVDKEISQLKAIADELKETSSVKHIVFSTLDDTRPIIGKDIPPLKDSWITPHFDGKGAMTSYFRDILKLPVTLYYTTYYSENSFGILKPNKGDDGVFTMAYPMADKPLAIVALGDLGKGAAKIMVQGPEKWAGKNFFVTSDLIPVAEMAAKLGAAADVTVNYYPITREGFAAFGFPGADDLANMFAFYQYDVFINNHNVEDSKALLGEVESFDKTIQKNIDAVKAALS
mmetsp:Transcript_4994/g.6499  ORF Transcript_4994/g.6499 Transcript_4994/m.6499 type:complete len:320 (-) Transcript_4994:498-1457(-)